MAEYLTESSYHRWYNRYQVNHQNCLKYINSLRNRLDRIERNAATVEIEDQLSELEKRLITISPRNFSFNAEPLLGIEKFIENIQVFCNLLCRAFRKEDAFPGIYQAEMNRVLLLHQGFKIKDELEAIETELEEIEKKTPQEAGLASIQL